MGSVTVCDGVASPISRSTEAMYVSPTIAGAELRRKAALALKNDDASGCSWEEVMRHRTWSVVIDDAEADLMQS